MISTRPAATRSNSPFGSDCPSIFRYHTAEAEAECKNEARTESAVLSLQIWRVEEGRREEETIRGFMTEGLIG